MKTRIVLRLAYSVLRQVILSAVEGWRVASPRHASPPPPLQRRRESERLPFAPSAKTSVFSVVIAFVFRLKSNISNLTSHISCLTSFLALRTSHIALLTFALLTTLYALPTNAQYFNSTGGKIHIGGGAMNVQGKMLLDTATRIETQGILQTNALKNSGIVDVQAGVVTTDTLRLEAGKVMLGNGLLVIKNADTLGIQTENGKLQAPNYSDGKVQWNIGEAAAGKKYTVPFVNDSLEDVSMKFEIVNAGTGANGYVEFSTFGTVATDSPNNLLHPSDLLYFPEAAATIDSNWNTVADRAWRTVAQGYSQKPQANITLHYAQRDVKGKNTIDLDELLVSKLKDRCWEQVNHAVIDTELHLITIDTAASYHLWMLHDTLQQQTCKTGFNCADAILIYDTVSFYPAVLTKAYTWFKFTATDTLMRLHVYQNQPEQGFYIDTVRLLQGACSGGFTSLAHVSTLLYESDLLKEYYLEFDELQVDSTYYLRLRQGENETSLPVLAFRRGRNTCETSGPSWSGRNEKGEKVNISIGEIIYTNCTPCHRPNYEGGLFADDGTHHDDAAGNYNHPLWFIDEEHCRDEGYSIYYYTYSFCPGNHNKMPLWKPCYNTSIPSCSNCDYPRFLGERILTDEEIVAIKDWFLADYPSGCEPYPVLPQKQTESQLDPAHRVENQIPSYQPDAQNKDDYQNFVLENPTLDCNSPYFTSAIFITKVEFIPGDVPVHHIALFRDDSPIPTSTVCGQSDQQITIQLQEVETDIGYSIEACSTLTSGQESCSAGQPSYDRFSIIATWVPGQNNVISFPCNFGMVLHPNQRLVVQMHYAKGTEGIDNTKINFEYTTQQRREIYTTAIGVGGAQFPSSVTITKNGSQVSDIQLDPNTSADFIIKQPVIDLARIHKLYDKNDVNDPNDDTFDGGSVPDEVSIMGIFPHMHLRGRTFDMYADNASTTGIIDEPLIKINDWDFNWQEVYILQKPIPFGTTSDDNFYIEAFLDNRCAFNTTLENYPCSSAYCSNGSCSGYSSDCDNGQTDLCCCQLNAGSNTTDEMVLGLVMWARYEDNPPDEDMTMDPEDPTYVQADAGLDNHLCNNNTMVIGPENPESSGVTYTWEPSDGLSDSDVPNPTVTEGYSDLYVLTATDDFGCSAKDTIIISGNCIPSEVTPEADPENPPTTPILPALLEYPDANTLISDICKDVGIGITDDVTYRRDGCIFKNNSWVIDLSVFGSDIVVKIDGNLVIDGSYTIKNCTYTSTGFDKSGGFRFGQNSSVIINAGKSLTLDNSYLSACSGNMWQGIKVKAGGSLITKNNTIIADAKIAVSGGYTGFVYGMGYFDLKNTRFYRNQAGVLGAYSNIFGSIKGCEFKYDAGQPLMNYLLPPDCGKHPTYGIGAFLTSGLEWNINERNTDDRALPNTFDGLNCGIWSYQSNMRVNDNAFRNIKNYNNIGPTRGVAVYGESATAGTLIVRTNSENAAAAAFRNCVYGVYAKNVNVEVSNNKMENVGNGIYATNCTGSAIFESNIITDGGNCINVNNSTGTRILNNQLEKNSTALSYFIQSCILASNSKGLQIENNEITGNDRYGTITELSNKRIGVHLYKSQGQLCNNTFDEIAYALQFQGNCMNPTTNYVTSLKQNTFNKCWYGVVLKDAGLLNPGLIGQQGSPTETHGNIFTGPFNNPSEDRTYCINSDGSNSPFWVIDTDNDDDLSNEEPKYNGTNSGLPEIQKIEVSTPTAEPWNCGASKTSFFTEPDFLKDEKHGTWIDVRAFPNPASSSVEITINGTNSPVLLEVFNIMGQSMLYMAIKYNFSFQVNSFKPGVYLLKFTGSNGAYFNSRLVIAR